jgi:acetyltransferase-like isoleucine patch superfamily enzyme
MRWAAGARLQADPDALLGYPSGRAAGQRLELGSDARIRSGSVLYAGARVGDRFECGHHVMLREDCQVGDDVSIWSNTVVDYGCRLGDRVKIHSNCYVAQFTVIEDDAFLAPGVSTANDLYPGQAASAAVMTGPSIGAGAQVGVNVTILPYVHIGAGALIGAGAVVVHDIPDGCVAYGNPAVVRGQVRDLSPIENRVDSIADGTGGHRFAMANGGRAGGGSP